MKGAKKILLYKLNIERAQRAQRAQREKQWKGPEARKGKRKSGRIRKATESTEGSTTRTRRKADPATGRAKKEKEDLPCLVSCIAYGSGRDRGSSTAGKTAGSTADGRKKHKSYTRAADGSRSTRKAHNARKMQLLYKYSRQAEKRQEAAI